MSIRFICSCGKHLRARDEMAARRSVCPRCGSPVGIPSLQPTHRGTVAAPLTPHERRRLRGEKPSEDSTTPEMANSITANLAPTSPSGTPALSAKPPRPRRVRRRRQLETHWTECLSYPFLGRRLLLGLALALTLLSASLVLLIPELPRLSETWQEKWLPYSGCLLLAFLIAAYACGSVESALRSALAGEVGGAYWPGWRIDDPLKSCLRWLWCFLAGPIVFIAFGCYYWLYGGDLTTLDWMIVAELGVFAIGYWLLSIVATNESDRFRDANPVRVAQLIYRLRYQAIVPVLAVPALVFVHGIVALFALAEVHQDGVHGWALLLACWCSGLFWATFLFRWFGVWCYRHPRMPSRCDGRLRSQTLALGVRS